MKKFDLKVCSNKGNARIWIEGKRLAEMGFKRGDKILVTTFPNIPRITIAICDDHPEARKVSGRVRNGRELPIIDICCHSLDFLKQYQKITVTQQGNGFLTIDPINATQEKAKTA